jgi:rod shape-determining protein MreC
MNIYRRIHDMKVRSTSSATAIAIRPRSLMHVFLVIAAFLSSIGLMIMDKGEALLPNTVRHSLQVVTAPMIELFSSPAEYLQQTSQKITDISNVYGQNQQLKEQNKTLLQWQTIAMQLEQENKELRALLHVQLAQKTHNITARVLSDKHNALSHSLMVRHNGDARIKVGQPVVAAEGLVGHVLKTKGEMATILLVTDRQSHIPIVHEETGERGILTGTNDKLEMMLEHVEDVSVFNVGDRIVTSKSALFPVRIVAGEVSKIEGDDVYIRSYTDTHKAQFVSIVTTK